MLCELKTGKNKDVLRVEAYQLMVNQVGEKLLHVPCLYVYRGKISDGEMVACYSKDIKVNTLVIPDRKSNQFIEDALLEYYDGCEVKRFKVDYPYSGDPYVTISAEDIKAWAHIDKFIN